MNRFRFLLFFFIIILSSVSAAAAQLPPGYSPGLNMPLPTPFVPNINVPTPFIPNIDVHVPDVPNVVIPTPFIPNIDVQVPDIVNVTVPTPVIRDFDVPVPDIMNVTVPTSQPITMPTLSLPTPVPYQPSFGSGFDMPVTGIDFRDFTDVTEPTAAPRVGQEGYDAGIAFFNEGKYYSAWKAFNESDYADWIVWAAKCPQPKPETGEVWHDPDQPGEDMLLTIRVEQDDTDMFFRLYRENALISNVYISGSDEVTVKLPGDARYTIKDGVGRDWYGEKETFGEYGSYETMIFYKPDYTESVFLRSGYQYTLTVNISTDVDSDGVDSEPETWENFTE